MLFPDWYEEFPPPEKLLMDVDPTPPDKGGFVLTAFDWNWESKELWEEPCCCNFMIAFISS